MNLLVRLLTHILTSRKSSKKRNKKLLILKDSNKRKNRRKITWKANLRKYRIYMINIKERKEKNNYKNNNLYKQIKQLEN